MIEDKLEIARRLFRKFDTDNSGTITENEVDIFFIKKQNIINFKYKKQVGPLLQETWKNMGVDYKPTDREIKSWVKMADTNQDGQVDLPEYE